MAWTNEDLVKLEKAIATGARSVEYTTGKVEYRSLSEMLQVRTMIRKALGLTVVTPNIVPKTSKGLD